MKNDSQISLISPLDVRWNALDAPAPFIRIRIAGDRKDLNSWDHDLKWDSLFFFKKYC